MKRFPILFALVCFSSAGALELPNIFSDHMVLQREAPVRIWGKAEPGALVQVNFSGESVSSKVADDGRWELYLPALEASFESRELTVVSGDIRHAFRDVLVGEVWLASGQSNMGWSVAKSIDHDILELGANDAFLRLHPVRHNPSREHEFSAPGRWWPDIPSQVAGFSAVGYQFAQDLRKTLQVPVGIIRSTVGGTPIIAWTREEKFDLLPELMEKNAEWEQALARYDEDYARWEKDYAEWLDQNGLEADYEAHRWNGAPWQPENAASPRRPASLANGMILPIAGYTIRGVIWYQGEYDAGGSPETYDQRLRVMIEDWRELWDTEELPFGIVQLANFMKSQPGPVSSTWSELRESQRRMAVSDPDVGLVVAIDVGEGNDIHPRDKFTVARRLARWALASVYGEIELGGGPEIVKARRENTKILLSFVQTGSGLHAYGSDELSGFTVSDSLVEPDKQGETNFYPVHAEIVSKTVVELNIPEGKNPVRVRYAWQSNPLNANLRNVERLPASPFEIKISE